MLTCFFKPESIAIVGASREQNKLGFQVLKNVIGGGFKGKIYPVNPKADEILNLKCYPDILSLPETPELVIIIIPAKFVCDVVRQCGKKGSKGIIVISAGFKESGEDGKKREKELTGIIKDYGIRLIGPNCLGLIDAVNNLNASFAFGMPPKGNIAFISQSGALGTAVLDWAEKEEIGLSKFISVGNMADVSEIDLIEFLGEDPDTGVILLYLEGIAGDGKRFIESAKKVTKKKKPVIIVKSGVTSSGLKAVSSHTGSLAGSDKAFESAFLQSGIMRSSSVQELFDYAMLFSSQPLLKGENIAIVTNAGGPSVMATDAIENNGLKLAELSPQTKESLKSFLPEAANINNPVDALGDVFADVYGRTLETVLNDDSVDAVICILSPQVITQIPETAEEVIRVSRKFKKPVVCCFMGGKRMGEAVRLLSRNSIPNYPFPERAVISLKGMVEYRKWTEKVKKGKIIEFDVEKEKVMAIFENVKKEGRKTIGDIEGRKILSSYGIKTIQSWFVKNPDELKNFEGEINFPCVMKLVSPDILHKTEADGVKVGLKNMEEAEDAFKKIVESAKKYKQDAKIPGVQIQPQLKNAQEVIVGINKDSQFGHLLMFGLGGIYVEILKDVSFRVIPITDVDAEEMISCIKGFKILQGFRNIPPADIESIKEVLLKVSKLCVDFSEIKEMDINPLMVFEKGKGTVAVDVRIAV